MGDELKGPEAELGLMTAAELGFEIEVLEKLEGDGRWPDLSRLEVYRPDALRAAVWMLGRKVPVRTICKALKLSPCTLQAIGEDPRWKLAVVTEKEGLISSIKLALRLSIDHKVEEAANGKLNMFDTKLLHDMLKDLEGGGQRRIEITITAEEQEAERFFTEARRRLQELPGMVLEGENLGGNGGLPAPRQVGPVIDVGGNAEAVQKNSEDSTGDSQSVVRPP